MGWESFTLTAEKLFQGNHLKLASIKVPQRSEEKKDDLLCTEILSSLKQLPADAP